MSEDMNLSVNGQSQVPPGFRFHPTEEELLHYYLRKKVASKKIDLDVIRDVDLNKLEPWDIQDKCKIGSTPQNDWYFFSHKDKKYPTGTRTNRATAAGFWKATGRDKVIHSSFRRIGMRKTLVFYKGRAPHGLKSDWIMHEYRLDDTVHDATAHNPPGGETVGEEGWVVCRVFRKKNYHKALESPQSSSTSMDLIRSSQMRNSSNDGILDQILEYMGRSCKQENETISNNLSSADCDNNNMHLYDLPSINTSIDHEIHDRFTHLPRLEATNAPTMPSLTNSNNSPFNQDYSSTFIKACGQAMDDVLGETEPSCADEGGGGCKANTVVYGHGQAGDRLNDWVALDRLVASQLNGQDQNASKLHLSCYGDPNEDFCFSTDHENVQLSQLRPNRPDTIQPSRVYSSDSEIDWWSFTRSSSSLSSDPLCHLSV